MKITFTFCKTTKNFHKYERTVEVGQVSGVLYFPLETFSGKPPKTVEIRVLEPESVTSDTESAGVPAPASF
jgi:hypothetical protein